MVDYKKEFWDRLEDVRAGLMEVDGRLFPMSPNVSDEDDGVIWFLTAHGTDAAKAAQAGKTIRFAFCDTGSGLHGSVKGTAAVSNNKEKLDEIWSFVAASWYEDGKEDPDLVLVQFTPKEGEIWLSPESGAMFLFETIKANITDEKPDLGGRATLTF